MAAAIRSQKAEGRSQKPEARRQKPEARSQEAEARLFATFSNRGPRDSDGDLFANPPDILLLIKLREIYSWLEESIDACKDVSQIVSEIVIKGS